MCRSVTLPSAGKSSSRSGSSACASARGPSPPSPPAPAAITARLSRSRRVTIGSTASCHSVPDAGHAHRLALVERGEEELELGVLHGIGGQHVHAERRHAPLHALSHVPHV